MDILLKVVHLFLCVFLVLLILLQSGRSGGMGSLGAASGQIFGGRGASNFLSRATGIVAAIFFISSLFLSMRSSEHRSVLLQQNVSMQKSDKASTKSTDTTEQAEQDAIVDEEDFGIADANQDLSPAQ